MTSADPQGEEGSICVGCGLCCDGTLHGTTTVRANDEATVAAAGLEIMDNGKRRFFRQPCPRFSCGTCTIYADRPEVCHTYRCALLIEVEAGRMSKLVAREKISVARKLISTVRSSAPRAVTSPHRRALVNWLKEHLEQSDDREKAAMAKILLNIGVLEHHLNRWFFKEKK